jgi:hypothetical protein
MHGIVPEVLKFDKNVKISEAEDSNSEFKRTGK